MKLFTNVQYVESVLTYPVLAKIGVGDMDVVYKAEDTVFTVSSL